MYRTILAAALLAGLATAAPAQDRAGPMGGMPPGMEQAAETLGVEVDALLAALDAAGGPRADLAQVAQTLGLSEDALRAALPTPPQHGRPPRG
ncbi:hypothetical protein [Paracoccus sp. Ld10]|uniref:hypothetical protein n=1 Tax=Paracoccus sp. Ld10 TaxID=649158 RepID=UPI003867DEB6